MAAKKKPKLEKELIEDADTVQAEMGFLLKYDLRAGDRCHETGRVVGRRNATSAGLSQLFVADDGDDEARPLLEEESVYGPPAISADGKHALANDPHGIVEIDIEAGTSTRVWEGRAPNDGPIVCAGYCGTRHVVIFTGSELALMRRSSSGGELSFVSALGTDKPLKGVSMARAHGGRAIVVQHPAKTTLVGLTRDGLEVLADLSIKKGSFYAAGDRVLQRDAATGDLHAITNLDTLLADD